MAETHYADEDRDLQPLCRGGEDGDLMTFFVHQTTCPDCLALCVSAPPTEGA